MAGPAASKACLAALAGDRTQPLGVIFAEQPQAGRQGQHEEQKQQLEFAREFEAVE
jgi:hypothetical protein